MTDILTRTLGNKMLDDLPRAQFEALAPHLTQIEMAQGLTLLESDDEFEQVYFPLSGMLSLLMVMRGDKAIEIATVGREGVVGAMAGLGLYKSSVRVVVQLPMAAATISASRFRKAASDHDAIRNLCIRYNEVLLLQARVTAACNVLHVVEARFCRWLLQSADRAGSDTVKLTQDFMSEMLGVQRTSVNDVAMKVQAAGVIEYARGVIRIRDRGALEKLACECYDRLKSV